MCVLEETRTHTHTYTHTCLPDLVWDSPEKKASEPSSWLSGGRCLTPCCGPQVLADAVARLVLDKFGDLTDNFTSPHARRKVLAGIVMTTGKHLAL